MQPIPTRLSISSYNPPRRVTEIVPGSHVGLACNRKVYRAIAEALARPELEG